MGYTRFGYAWGKAFSSCMPGPQGREVLRQIAAPVRGECTINRRMYPHGLDPVRSRQGGASPAWTSTHHELVAPPHQGPSRFFTRS